MLGDNLLVLDIESIENFETLKDNTAFDIIDESLYGCDKFTTLREKVEWVCDNFEQTQTIINEL